CQVVLHLLEGRKNGLPVIRHSLIIRRAVLLNGSLAQPGIKNGFGKAWANGPEAVWPGKPVRNRRGSEAAGGGEQDRREIGSFGHPDFRVRLSDGTLGSRNVRAPLKKLGRNASRDCQRICRQRIRGQRKCRGGFAGENRDGVFILRAQDTKVGILGLRRLQLSFSLSHSLVRTETGAILVLGQVQSLLVSDYRGIEYLLQ